MTITYIEIDQGSVKADEVTKPTDRTFRQAWQIEGAVIDVDMDQARDIWREKIRVARGPEFDRLDAEYMKALETGDATLQASIAEQKQVLRDAPDDAAIDAAMNPEELMNVQPAGLTIL